MNTRTRSTTRRRIPLAVAAACMALVALVATAPVAAAHGGDGVLEPVSVTPDGRSVEVSVRLTYESDGHDATGATVTVAGDDGAGAALTPVSLTDQGGGTYGGTVELPSDGTWNLRVTAVEPPAQLALPAVTVAAAPSTTAADASSSTSTSAPSTADAGAVDGAEATEGIVALGDDEDGGGTAPWVWVVAGVAVVAAVAAGLLFVARGRRPGPID